MKACVEHCASVHAQQKLVTASALNVMCKKKQKKDEHNRTKNT